MRANLERRLTVSEPVGRDGVLHSWKEIAAYLGRSCRTVQRWERSEGLPVRRLQHKARGSVYAFESELNAWWSDRGRQVLDVGNTLSAPERPAGGVGRRVVSMAQRMWKGAVTRLLRT